MEAVKQNDKEAGWHGAKETSRGRPKPRISEGSCSKEADLESVMGIQAGRQGAGWPGRREAIHFGNWEDSEGGRKA